MGIKISEKHGVNPSMGICYYCGEPDGTIALLGRLPGDREAPRYGLYTHEPCPKCKELMKQGVMILECKDGEVGKKDPYRTGQMWVVKDDYIRRIISDVELREDILKKRVTFLDESTAKALGLPKGDT